MMLLVTSFLAEIIEEDIDFLGYLLGAFAAIFPMVNPFSTMPLFLSLTAGMSHEAQQRQALKASILCGVIMLTVLFIGAAILQFFGISLGALRVAGGLIVAYIGFRMLFPAATPTPQTSGSPHPAEAESDFSFMPLAFPSLAGAGTMAVVMSMTTHVGDLDVARHRLYAYAIVSGAIIAVAILTWIILRASTRLTRFIGPRGLDAMTRVMGLLLVCIGVQFIATGVRNFIQNT